MAKTLIYNGGKSLGFFSWQTLFGNLCHFIVIWKRHLSSLGFRFLICMIQLRRSDGTVHIKDPDCLSQRGAQEGLSLFSVHKSTAENGLFLAKWQLFSLNPSNSSK